MAITTVSQMTNKLVQSIKFYKATTPTLTEGRLHSLFYLSGFPPAATAPTPGMSGAALTNYAGQIPYNHPASNNAYIAKITAQSSATLGTLYVCDRLWHNSGISVTSTAAQTINSVAFPERASGSLAGAHGIQVGLEFSVAGGAAATATISYTSGGMSGYTATTIQSGMTSSAIGAFYEFGVAGNDIGAVQSIQTFTLSSSLGGGAVHLVAYRTLAEIAITEINKLFTADVFLTGHVRTYQYTVPFLLFKPLGTTATSIHGSITWVYG